MLLAKFSHSNDLWAWYFKCVGVESERFSSVFLSKLQPDYEEARGEEWRTDRLRNNPRPPPDWLCRTKRRGGRWGCQREN